MGSTNGTQRVVRKKKTGTLGNADGPGGGQESNRVNIKKYFALIHDILKKVIKILYLN